MTCRFVCSVVAWHSLSPVLFLLPPWPTTGSLFYWYSTSILLLLIMRRLKTAARDAGCVPRCWVRVLVVPRIWRGSFTRYLPWLTSNRLHKVTGGWTPTTLRLLALRVVLGIPASHRCARYASYRTPALFTITGCYFACHVREQRGGRLARMRLWAGKSCVAVGSTTLDHMYIYAAATRHVHTGYFVLFEGVFCEFCGLASISLLRWHCRGGAAICVAV
jgi:hypothetical protein